MNKFQVLFLLIAVFYLSACQNESEAPTSNTSKEMYGFELLDNGSIGLDFENSINANKELNFLTWDAIYYGSGVAIGDINNDGLADVFFGGNQVPDQLYLNKGQMQFENISESAGFNSGGKGWTTGVSMADVNGDGLLDIYVCRSAWSLDNQMQSARTNKLYINQGNSTFVEQSAAYGVDSDSYSTQCAWLDFDHDGDLDLFLLNSPSNNIQQKIKYNAAGFPENSSDAFYRNENGQRFTNISKEVGVRAFSYGLGVIATDLNHDGWTDLYVANDYERPDYMYINNGKGQFTNQLNQKVKHTSYTSMGVDAADIDNDCFVDLMVLDMQPEEHERSKTNMPTMQPATFWDWVKRGYNLQYMTNVLQLNNGVGYFNDIAQMAGVASTDWSWSVLLADFDNDGYKDIHVTNGINKDIRNNDFADNFEQKMNAGEHIDLLKLSESAPTHKTSNYLFKNNGDYTFEKKTADWNLNQASFSFGSAYGDLDNDGDLDLLVNNNNMPAFIYENKVAGNNWLRIKINGDKKNKFGLGTKAIIFHDGKKQYSELTNTRGFQSSSEPFIHFGLGKNTSVDSMTILFTSGKVVKKKNIKTNQLIEINESNAKKEAFAVYGKINREFVEVTNKLNLDYTHKENEFDDYEYELLLPHKASKNGPFMDKADVNNDGLEDFIVGAAAGEKAVLYLQEKSGKFYSKSGPWEKDKAAEDMGICFVDVDMDKDMDVYFVSGGSHLKNGNKNYADRLYLNDGNGNFTKSNLIDKERFNGSCVRKADIDQDGDMDLFIGGRGEAGKYPHPGQSKLLINNKGVFENKINELAVGLEKIGMVTDAEWIDIDNDKDLDLFVVGEWMSPTIYENDNGHFSPSELNASMNDLSGWWFDLNAADINNDGRIDIILGNIGANNKFHVTDTKPLRIYSNDFDHNNKNDVVLAKLNKDKYVPLRGRECSSQQLPFISEKFKNFEGFATASLEEVYGETELKEAFFNEVKEFRSGVLVNRKTGFEFIPFPNLAQVSPIMGTTIKDYNKDGHLDILIAGNHFDAEVETTRHDSGNGLLLLGDSEFNFETKRLFYSGFYAPGNVKGLQSVRKGKTNKDYIFLLTNDDKMTVFEERY